MSLDRECLPGSISRLGRCRRVLTWVTGLVVLAVLALLLQKTYYSSSSSNQVVPRLERSLPVGSLVFSNGFAIFQVDSTALQGERVSVLFESSVCFGLTSPSLSADGSRLVFVWTEPLSSQVTEPSSGSCAPKHAKGIHLLNLQTRQSPRLLWRNEDDSPESGLVPLAAQWSGDGQSIWSIITDYKKGDPTTIYRLSTATLRLRPVLECDDYCLSVSPAPESNQIVFTSFVSSTKGPVRGGTISLLTEDGSTTTLVRSDGVDHYTSPTWSPDESQIAFTMQTGDYRSVFLANLDNMRLVQLTSGETIFTSTAWAPDGKTLAVVERAYVGSGSVTSRIALVNVESKEVQSLLFAPWAINDLQWQK